VPSVGPPNTRGRGGGGAQSLSGAAKESKTNKYNKHVYKLLFHTVTRTNFVQPVSERQNLLCFPVDAYSGSRDGPQ